MKFIKKNWLLFILYISIILYFLISYLRGDRPGCDENRQFFLNKLNNTVDKIVIDSFTWYKGISYYIHLDDSSKTILFVNPAVNIDLIERIKTGDSIVKYSNTPDFKIFRSSKLIYEYNEYECVCSYCK